MLDAAVSAFFHFARGDTALSGIYRVGPGKGSGSNGTTETIMSRNSFCILALLAGAALLSNLAPARADEEVTVIGWVAVGYDENGRSIGRSKWYPDKSDAEADAEFMRKQETLTGKF